MGSFLFKLIVSAALIAAASELSRRYTAVGALVASLPLVSLLSMTWLYVETGDREKVSAFSIDVFWLVLPSLALFLLLPVLLRAGWSFWVSLAISCGVTVILYVAEVRLLRWLGVER